jgi:hypothetical protein
MIHISIEGIEPTDKEWLEKAQRLTDQLKAATNAEERKAIIERNKGMWGQVKEWLKGLSHGKCWYSEAKELCSFYDVDHFRPKNNVVELDGSERDGYWWLAFEWTNYRLSGQICNRPNKNEDEELRGKWDYFPLQAGSRIACCPEDDLRDEIICLLDPTDPDDPVLLSFDEAGDPVAADEVGSWHAERVAITVKLLHLDSTPLVEERKKIWRQCRKKLDKAQRIMKDNGNRMSASLKSELKHLQEDLREMVSSETELAGTARACLLKSGVGWAQNIVASAR